MRGTRPWILSLLVSGVLMSCLIAIRRDWYSGDIDTHARKLLLPRLEYSSVVPLSAKIPSKWQLNCIQEYWYS